MDNPDIFFLLLCVVIAALLPMAGVRYADRTAREVRRRNRPKRPANADFVLSIPSVTIADDLIPLIDDLIAEFPPAGEKRLQVMGGDGKYITLANGEQWRNGIRSWTDKGLNVDYILLDADEEVIRELKGLQFECQQNLGDFSVSVLNRDKATGIGKLVEGLKTRHPTLFFGPGNERAMWIEGNHPEESEFAFDVSYVSPRAMERHETARSLFEKYQSEIDSIAPFCSPIDEAHQTS